MELTPSVKELNVVLWGKITRDFEASTWKAFAALTACVWFLLCMGWNAFVRVATLTKAFAAETACVMHLIYEFNGVHVCKLLLALIYLLH